MADRHYTTVPQDLLNEAVLWLGDELGVKDVSNEQKKSVGGAKGGYENLRSLTIYWLTPSETPRIASLAPRSKTWVFLAFCH